MPPIRRTTSKKTPRKRPLSQASRKRLEKQHDEMGREPVVVTVKGDLTKVTYKIQKWVKMEKIARSYAARRNMLPSDFLYYFEDTRFHLHETPNQLGMGSAAEIEIRPWSTSA